MNYYACYGYNRYIVKAAESREALEPDALDFRIASEFEGSSTAQDYCNSINLYLCGKLEVEQDEELVGSL